jgi:superfamily II DNA or RNA helicase
MLLTIPPVFDVDDSPGRNLLRRLAAPAETLEGHLSTFKRERLSGWLFRPDTLDAEFLLIPRKTQPERIPQTYEYVLIAEQKPDAERVDLSASEWMKHPAFITAVTAQEAVRSWHSAFSYIQEDQDRRIVGLRAPQIGALHAVHAHWSVSDATATIVMPTGTGKTETMLAVLTSAECTRVLVVVPTDALRSQIAEKFLTLGILKTQGSNILTHEAERPSVLVLKHKPKSPEAAHDLFVRANVIVTTSTIAGQCSFDVQQTMAELCTHLFVDEAHHAEAPTWRAFKERFSGRRILQFTATPFREDGQPLDGKLIYVYPLRKAQQEGYFKRIRFVNVVEFDPTRSDQAIAAAGIEQLRKDYERGHILMARADSISRAEEVFAIYERFTEFNPVQIHTGMTAREREEARRKILSKEARVIVCVDMLGEGFDLPELKIAAFHDIRKTLAVTLQLAGRFTRSREDLGDATFIANTADVDVREELRKLYAREPDWNVLLPELTEQAIGAEQSLQQFLEGFTDFTEEIPLNTVAPALSSVVYRTRRNYWTPGNIRAGIPNASSCEQVHVAINESEHTIVVVTARRVELPWADVESLYNWDWQLYVVFWWQERRLLFINGSSNAGEYKGIAQAVCGDDVELIKGDVVFRTFAGVTRLRLNNVGLSEQLGRNVSYTGRMGADVAPVLDDVQRRRARKSVLAGAGYERGEHATVGASRKGRIWSHRRDTLDELVAWCRQTGEKLLDGTIDPDAVLSGTLLSNVVERRPEGMPIGVDWPWEIYSDYESRWSVSIAGSKKDLSEVNLEVVDATLAEPIRFAIVAKDARAEFELEFYWDGEVPDFRFSLLADQAVRVHRSEMQMDAATFFTENPPRIWLADGASLDGNEYTPLRSELPPYNPERLEAWDWTGTNIRKESRGDINDPESIQAAVIRRLLQNDYDVIFDDDDAGEAADVVTLKLVGGQEAPTAIEVEFYHIKFSSDDAPGGRVKDLYVVCGQAQTCIRWMASPDKRTDLFTHLLRRDAKRLAAERPSRFVRGDQRLMQTIREISRAVPVGLRVTLVQPGVSKGRVSEDQLRLLAVTQNYLMETYQLSLTVVTSQ